MLFSCGGHRYRFNTGALYLHGHCPAEQLDGQEKSGEFFGTNQNSTDAGKGTLADPHAIPSELPLRKPGRKPPES